MNSVDLVRDTLLAAIEPLDRKTYELQEELDQVQLEKAPLIAALEAIDPPKSKKGSVTSKTFKPSPKQSDVRQVCVALVKENPGIKNPDLEELVKHKLTEEMGFGLRGFAKRYSEVFGSKTFVIEADETISIASSFEKNVPDKEFD